jgi:hypothetical protein
VSGEPLPGRLLREMKQSPVKAFVLIAGAVLACVVWVPRAVSDASPAGPTDAGAATDGSTPEALAGRDPAAIRAEFISISEEAKSLRRFSDPVTPPPLARDPFVLPRQDETEPEQPVYTTPPDDGVDPREKQEQEERERAAALRLSGVFQFPRGKNAVVDGQVVAVGDEVAGFTVERIEARACMLRGTHDVYVISMDAGLDATEKGP